MRRARRILLAATAALFAAIGLVLAAIGEGEDRVLGLAVFLFFGVGALAAFAMPLATHRDSSPRSAVVAHRGVRRLALVFAISRAKLRLAGLGAAGMALGSLLFGLESVAVAVVGGGVFGAFAVLALLSTLRPAYVALLPDGILARAPAGTSFVPWDAIEDVAVIELHDNPMVAVRAKDPDAVVISRMGRWLARGNRALIDSDLAYTGLATSEEALATAIAHYLEHPDERARIGTEDPPRYTGPRAVPR